MPTDDIVYPQGCRPVSEDLGPDELIRRLKTLAHTLQAMAQDEEGQLQQYVPLSLHLAEEAFMHHPSRDVQLLIACCIADVLRVYAPEAPYKDPEQVKTIFIFLINQLSGLQDPKDPAFKRYFYLLENLAYVKSFNMCFELEDCQEIFCRLFQLMFEIVNDEHSSKVKSFMLDVLSPLITESDVVSNELLNIILINIVEPNKSSRKNAYWLAKELLLKCSSTLEPYIQVFFNNVLIMGKQEKELEICSKVYDLIYELYHICPSVLLAVLPQLECKLKSSLEAERLAAVALLARMFSEKDSTLARHHTPLWRAFLGRFNDISVNIRIKCVQYSMHFLLNHPELRRDMTETLKLRLHDAEENVRFEVVMAIVSTAKKDCEVVSSSEDLLELVKERTLDKKFKIRREAMSGLGLIYKNHLNSSDVPQATKKAVTWIKDRILHGYYLQSNEDRLLVERLLNTDLVSYQLPPEERMKRLYHLLGTVDDNALKAFIELKKSQLVARRIVSEFLELHYRPESEERDQEISTKVTQVSKFLPDPVKAQEFIVKLSNNLLNQPDLLQQLSKLVRPDISCRESIHITGILIKSLGNPIMTNLYFNNVKMLLERISSVMIDSVALEHLIGYVEDCLKGGNSIEEIGLNPSTAGERGVRLIQILSFVYPAHYLNLNVLNALMRLLEMDDETVAPWILSALTFVGKYKPLGEMFPEFMENLVPTLRKFIEEGTPKQSKQAVRCLHRNLLPEKHDLFKDIFENLKKNLEPSSDYYLTAIVALGHIAYNLPTLFPYHIKNIISRKIVRELLVVDSSESRYDPTEEPWCSETDLDMTTRCKLEGMKTMSRWLLGLKEDVVSAQKTFRMLNAFITSCGDLTGQNKLSKAAMSWLRLRAGCVMLRISEQKGVGDQFNAEQFYDLSHLMVDEVPQVREIFSAKLHKGLSQPLPGRCLPLDFMGIYALAGLEQDKKLKGCIKKMMVSDICKRREYAKSLTLSTTGSKVEKAMAQLPAILPDYMLTFAIPVLAHLSEFTDPNDVEQLKQMRSCLWFILEPLIIKNDLYSFSFYKNMIERMKNQKDALKPDDTTMNYKLWALCDLAMTLVLSKTTNFDMKELSSEVRIPTMYFKSHENPLFNNNVIYIPSELQYQANKNKQNLLTTATKRTVKSNKKITAGVENSGIDNKTDVKPSEASDTKIKLYGMGNEPPSPGEANSAEETSCETEDIEEKIRNDRPKRKKTGH
ncbi:hypothetical protein RUM43_013082 [Polyplax serrata]|uniref:Uncharacterized protein n=1 Tax=Polyplax serrata TaxID=468196 RepID=A0AAN8PTB0_POLSC